MIRRSRPTATQLIAWILATAGGCNALGTDVIELSPTAAPTCSGPDCSATCRRTADLLDDFDDGVAGPVWGWSVTEGDAAIAEVGGELTLQPGRTGAGRASRITSHSFALTSSQVSIEVTHMVAPSPLAWFHLQLFSARDDRLRMYVQNGALRASYLRSGASFVELSSTPYQALEQRYWRIRESAGVVHWETAKDGVSWRSVASATVGFSVQWVHVQLEAGSSGAAGDLGAAHLNHLNLVGGSGSGSGGYTPCPIASVTDDFGDGARSGLWERSTVSAGARAEERDGALSLMPPQAGAGEASYGTVNPYDVRGGAAVVQVVSMVASAAGLHAELELADDSSSRAAIEQRQGRIACVLAPGGSAVEVGGLSYSAAAHVFWRLREAAGVLFCETSGDGQSYTALGSGPAPFDPRGVYVNLRAASTAAQAGPGAFALAAFNP